MVQMQWTRVVGSCNRRANMKMMANVTCQVIVQPALTSTIAVEALVATAQRIHICLEVIALATLDTK